MSKRTLVVARGSTLYGRGRRVCGSSEQVVGPGVRELPPRGTTPTHPSVDASSLERVRSPSGCLVPHLVLPICHINRLDRLKGLLETLRRRVLQRWLVGQRSLLDQYQSEARRRPLSYQTATIANAKEPLGEGVRTSVRRWVRTSSSGVERAASGLLRSLKRLVVSSTDHTFCCDGGEKKRGGVRVRARGVSPSEKQGPLESPNQIPSSGFS